MPKILSRDEALAWNPKWSTADRRLISDEFDRVAATSFYQTDSNSYVGAMDAQGKRVLFVAPGYLEFASGQQPTDRELSWNGYELSTFQPRGNSSSSAEPSETFCPVHFLAVPATGKCDDCD